MGDSHAGANSSPATERPSAVASLMTALAARQLTLAVAESLTGGLLMAELIGTPGASVVVLGGVVAYNTESKHTLLGVDSVLLAREGPVHPEVAMQMAVGVRERLVVGGRQPEIGLSTTGVAGPGASDGNQAGTVFLGLAFYEKVQARHLALTGTRNQIRAAVVAEAVSWLAEELRKDQQR